MTRPLRADAQANRDRLLEVAARAFARDGTAASLKAIAAEAGVGIGTLYRRFPTREDLIEATYRNSSARLSQAATQLLDEHPPQVALRRWMESFVDYMITKRGMSDALPAILATRDGLRTQTRALLEDAIAVLLSAGAAAGELRRDASAYDILMALGGITLITAHEQQPELASRLITVLIDGLAVGACPAPAQTD